MPKPFTFLRFVNLNARFSKCNFCKSFSTVDICSAFDPKGMIAIRMSSEMHVIAEIMTKLNPLPFRIRRNCVQSVEAGFESVRPRLFTPV